MAHKDLRPVIQALAWTARMLEKTSGAISLPQYRVLALIAAAPERASALAERAAVTRPALTSLIDSLVDRGLVARSQVAGDRRGVLLQLTEAGKAAIHLAEAHMAERLEKTLAHSDDPRVIIAGLTALRKALETETRLLLEDQRTRSGR